MLASVPSPMTVAMVKAHMESLGAGFEFPLPPFGKVSDFSLGPEAKNVPPPSLDPRGPRDPSPQLDSDSVQDLTPEPSTDFIEALLADDETPPPSFLADEEPRLTPRQDVLGKMRTKTSPMEREVEVFHRRYPSFPRVR